MYGTLGIKGLFSKYGQCMNLFMKKICSGLHTQSGFCFVVIGINNSIILCLGAGSKHLFNLHHKQRGVCLAITSVDVVVSSD